MGAVVTGELLMDNSAWSHFRSRSVSQERLIDIAEAFRAGRVYTCLPFLLEAGYSARSGADHQSLLTEFGALPLAAIDTETEQLALDAQAQLARTGHHRIPPVDIIIGAIAARHGLGVLHYDADYDIIAARTSLTFESIWLAPRGSL